MVLPKMADGKKCGGAQKTLSVKFDSCSFQGQHLVSAKADVSQKQTKSGTYAPPAIRDGSNVRSCFSSEPAAPDSRGCSKEKSEMNLPSFPNVDLFSAGINALNGVLVARNPSHNRGYAVVGLLIMAFFGGIGGGVSRDVLLNDIPSPLRDQ